MPHCLEDSPSAPRQFPDCSPELRHFAEFGVNIRAIEASNAEVGSLASWIVLKMFYPESRENNPLRLVLVTDKPLDFVVLLANEVAEKTPRSHPDGHREFLFVSQHDEIHIPVCLSEHGHEHLRSALERSESLERYRQLPTEERGPIVQWSDYSWS
ncbi:unnamed protein product [Zymoseptoria tritici ST99CH_3D7]|uniref:Uncharacterized protein n=1 Tax=Zymoseptoria tritici (strain ST99CH_3D7) TaxID=1276538 RepID=A0A1X7S9Y2_ZYMT9|nr:unnamed protein product [Zymoseptoria tritici ST99CH_3D7]